MKLRSAYSLFIGCALLCACQSKSNKNNSQPPGIKAGTFGYDLDFLKRNDSLVILQGNNGRAKVIVSAKYQGKVFTSTADGDTGRSFGWINYKAFSAATDPHMNVYGGEDRLWLGPEGGQYSVFFKPKTKMEFANWHTPAGVDHESWSIVSKDSTQVTLKKDMQITNFRGTLLKLTVDRIVDLLETADIEKDLHLKMDNSVKAVGIKTVNSITNTGGTAWTTATGAPCLWSLDQFTPSPQVTIVVPYKESASGKVATTDYFGQIPPDRVTYKNGHLFFKADGKSRGKLGMPAARSTSMAGSYDAANNVLTVTLFDINPKATYLNQEWTPDKDPLVGDAANAYNDGPLADGSQLGPFYELESVSPGAFLKPGGKLTHQHCIFHFTGSREGLNAVALKTLGVSLKDIQSALK